ncbi:HAMP domain-containing sensor histidine kinase [Oceanobacillus oncorhynchi]|uniref:HAMP domain-containing sensor histidine kinase n=1 Tax=Oceanobacillus oncorhynchi TaxID=545501 RepID=UPI001867B009|nr:HAMP domain-containing sensor histidine kinase [Oceanobacillus oncorhynchi]MDM8099986.1 HAMP domain-containing sensor histidine kinase [Oceanobacillus oncorhynchi]UUI40536.1 HAMP domain-containing histidine kinase [Oceanobacillus oncorhynchi]
MKRFLKSLLAKYILIILIAIFLIQAAYFIIIFVFFNLVDDSDSPEDGKNTFTEIEEKWHQEANAVVSEDDVNQLFEEWREVYSNASMFWVNGNGILSVQSNLQENLPVEWDATYTADFLKRNYNNDPFTVVAFAGENEEDGFIVFQLEREAMKPQGQRLFDQYSWAIVMLTIGVVFLFIFISLWFFRGIRKRLVHLQEAMEIRDTDGLPIPIEEKKQDEIGDLEKSFNQMVQELRESREREQEEEQLRKELIANLSHDLRTPLTKINAQAYTLQKMNLPKEAKHSLKLATTSIEDVDKLIENLMSYTLLMASKYKKELKEIDMMRFLRQYLATWYPVFEKERFEVDIDIEPFEQNMWKVDSLWFSRILDNLLQNVLRHAADGKYIAVRTESTGHNDAIVIIDKGKGMQTSTNQNGAGIGLSIVDMMVKGMDLDWEMDSTEEGTTIKIIRVKRADV